MALVDTTWYANSVAYAAVPAFAISTAYTAGQRVRQLATPTVGNERVFICIVAGTSAGSEPSWTLTRGAKTTTGTATFQECTGEAALNGDLTNTTTWAAVKAATPAVLGQIIKRSSGASYQICTTAGAMSASEPAFSDTAGVTTTDTTAVWTSLGAVGSYTGGMAPFARLVAACASTWWTSGSTIYVSSNHAETQATAITINPAGTFATTGKILCHNVAGSYPPASTDLRTTATVTTTGSVNITINATGPLYVYGLTFAAAVGTSGSNTLFLGVNNNWVYYDNCSLQIGSSFNAATIATGSYGVCILNNTTVKFGNVAQSLQMVTPHFLWMNTGQILASGSSVPSVLIKSSVATTANTVTLEALDLSQITGTLVGSSNEASGFFMIRDCKLNATATVSTPTASGMIVQLARSSA